MAIEIGPTSNIIIPLIKSDEVTEVSVPRRKKFEELYENHVKEIWHMEGPEPTINSVIT